MSNTNISPNQAPRLMFMNHGEKLLVGHGDFQAYAEPPTEGVAFYRQNYDLSETHPWWVPSEVSEGDEALLAQISHFLPPQIAWEETIADPFSEVFREVMHAIRIGTLEKCVPVVVEQGQLQSGHPSQLAASLLDLPGMLQAYGWWSDQEGLLGATPENLFDLSEQGLRTMALAGTAKHDEKAVFQVDEKEIREHEFVAQSLISKLSDLGQVQRDQRRILDLGKLVHFQTLIQVELEKSQSIDHLVRRLHPTPALGPLPRTAETMEMATSWRRQLNCPAWFGAPFGLLAEGTFHALVSIRLIHWQDDLISLPSGCGIIEESRLVNEWRELRLKREAVKEILGLA